MIRRSILPPAWITVAVLTVLACTDDPIATAPRRPVALPVKPGLVIAPVLPSVQYGTGEYLTYIENANITSVESGEISADNIASVEAGSEFTVTGHYRYTSVPMSSSVGRLGWLTDPDDSTSYQRFPEYLHAIFYGLATDAGEGDFEWTTRAPSFPGRYLIAAAQVRDGEWESRLHVYLGYDPNNHTDPVWASYQITVKEPAIVPAVNGTLGGGGWYTSDVNIDWDVRTVVLSIESKTGCDPVTISSDTPGTTVTCSIVAAGLPKSKSVTVKRDATKPVVTPSVTPAANGNGWNKGSVTVNWTCTDAGSGPQAATGSKTVSTEGSNQSVNATCTDVAGNTATVPRAGINIDLTPPTLDPKMSADTIPLNATGSASPNAADALSGIAAASCDPVVTSVAGKFTINCTATDKAGNSASKSVSYFVKSPYNFGGFQSPIGASNSINSANAGSTVPVKFSVGGNKGLDILAAGSPSSKPLACSASAPVNTIASTAAAGAGGGGLTYDASTDTYTYSWKTEKSWAGTCRTLVVKLKDGLEHTADFKFTK